MSSVRSPASTEIDSCCKTVCGRPRYSFRWQRLYPPAPTVDYASSVWMHVFKDRLLGPINRVQRTGAQAIIGAFSTVATWVAEAEAHIPSAGERFWRRAVKLWTDIHTLPDTNPLRRNTSRMRKFRKQHRSPLYQVADAVRDIAMEQLETINPCTLMPWEIRLPTVVDEVGSRHLAIAGVV